MAEECARNYTGNDPFKYMPFDNCLEGGGSISEQTITSCAKQNLDSGAAADITSCLTDGRGDKLIAAAEKATVDHPGVPWVTYNGKSMDDYTTVLKQACKDWTG